MSEFDLKKELSEGLGGTVERGGGGRGRGEVGESRGRPYTKESEGKYYTNNIFVIPFVFPCVGVVCVSSYLIISFYICIHPPAAGILLMNLFLSNVHK